MFHDMIYIIHFDMVKKNYSGPEGLTSIHALSGTFSEGEMGGGRGWINLGTTSKFLPITNIATAFLNFPVYHNTKIFFFLFLTLVQRETNTFSKGCLYCFQYIKPKILTAVVCSRKNSNELSLCKSFETIKYTLVPSYNHIYIITLTKCIDPIRLHIYIYKTPCLISFRELEMLSKEKKEFLPQKRQHGALFHLLLCLKCYHAL